MRMLIFTCEIFKKFPFLLITNTILILAGSLFSACSLLAISPIIDFFIHPDLHGISPITVKAVNILEFVGLPVTLWSWSIIFISFVAFASIFRLFAGHSVMKIKYAMLRDIVLGTFEDFFNAQWYFFSSGKQGVLLNTFMREMKIVGDAFGAMAIFFAGILQTIFYLAVPFYISWKVTLISLGVALLFVAPFILLGKLSYHFGTLNTITANRLNSFIHENLSLAKLVLGYSNQRKSIGDLDRAFEAHRDATIKSQILATAVPILYQPFGIVMIIIALFAARHFNVLLSEVTVLLFGLLQVAVSIGNQAMQKNSLENFFPSYEQIKTLRERAKGLREASGTRQFDRLTREISMDGVSFAYPAHEPILFDINARIPKGKMVAFVGESGSGKTTIIDMIVGFHKPTRGQVTIDGIRLDDFDMQSYRKRIGYVPQDSVLFNTTIGDNLLWASETATHKELIEACRQANADEFIKELPNGYDTIVGDRGVRLSGGQIQRVALARAILRKPELLILDEATSALDTYSERLIQQAIEKIAKETTVIIIAHRLSTIINADYIYVIKKGRLVEEGTYGELIKLNGYFKDMVNLQLLETRVET